MLLEHHTDTTRMPSCPCQLVSLPTFTDDRGSLSVVEAGDHVSFPIKRIYYIYDTPALMARGGHGHRELQQLIVAVHGHFEIRLDDGYRKWSFHLDRPDFGLYLGPRLWRDLVSFSPGAVALVLASRHYEEADYYRDYRDFRTAVRGGS